MSRLALALAAVAVTAAPAAAGDPDRVWKTLESQHFVDPLLRGARRGRAAGRGGGRAPHQVLAPALRPLAARKTQVVLVDDTDGANGFAHVLPRNQVTLFATAPTPSSVLADHDDWLYGLVAHEYTHILHLDTDRRAAQAVQRDLVGKTWAPNQVMPRWVIEGLATYEESKRSSGGRTRNTSSTCPAGAGPARRGAQRLDQISGSPRAFPRGNAAYLYGVALPQVRVRSLRRRRRAPHVVGLGARPGGAVRGQPPARRGRSTFDALYDDWRLPPARQARSSSRPTSAAAPGRAAADLQRRDHVATRATRPTAASCTGSLETGRHRDRSAPCRSAAIAGAARDVWPSRPSAPSISRPTGRWSSSRAGSTATTTRSRIWCWDHASDRRSA
jgi:hypothetical protein